MAWWVFSQTDLMSSPIHLLSPFLSHSALVCILARPSYFFPFSRVHRPCSNVLSDRKQLVTDWLNPSAPKTRHFGSFPVNGSIAASIELDTANASGDGRAAPPRGDRARARGVAPRDGTQEEGLQTLNAVCSFTKKPVVAACRIDATKRLGHVRMNARCHTGRAGLLFSHLHTARVHLRACLHSVALVCFGRHMQQSWAGNGPEVSKPRGDRARHDGDGDRDVPVEQPIKSGPRMHENRLAKAAVILLESRVFKRCIVGYILPVSDQR
jgi:hypothetical protein